MAKLELSLNFQTGSTTYITDYGGSGKVSQSMTDITIAAGPVGNAAEFNGTSSAIVFTQSIAGGTDKASFLIQLRRTVATEVMLISKENQFSVRILASLKIRFSLFIGSVEKVLDSFVNSSGATETIECIYDGSDMFIYVDGILDTSQNQTGNIYSNANDFTIGHQAVPIAPLIAWRFSLK